MAKTARQTESGILGAVHKTAIGLPRAGVIDMAAMHELGDLCRAPIRADQGQRKVAHRAK